MNTELTIYSDIDPSHVILHTTNRSEIGSQLKEIEIFYEIWPIDKTINECSSHEQILLAYDKSIKALIEQGGYQSYDVIALNPSHPDKTTLRQKFLKEHTHAEDEIRFFVAGSGLFTVHKNGYVYNILCVEGDLINVPAGTTHWFDMGPDPRFVAIRIFNNPAGWVANFTGSDIADKFPRYEPSLIPSI